MGSQVQRLKIFKPSIRRSASAFSLALIACVLAIVAATEIHADAPTQTQIQYQHGYAFLTDPARPDGFSHFPYVNPDAPKGGEMRIPEMGTWDNFNPIALKGRTVRGVWFWVSNYNLIHDRLMEPALDEPASYYGRLAQGIAVAEDGAWIAFKLREGARWHDGKPITVDDVVFTFETMKDKRAAPSITTPMQMIERIEVLNDREFRFWVEPEARGNAVLPIRLGNFPILPKHYWADKDVFKTTVHPPLGSGPYRIADYNVGRYVRYERVADYWGKDLPVNKGKYNFDSMRIEFFRDDRVQHEAVKGHLIDAHIEHVGLYWLTGYDFPAVKDGLFRTERLQVSQPASMWWPIMWNVAQKRFQDIRVREALWLALDPTWGSQRGQQFYGVSTSFFQNTEMANRGLPSDLELELLEPLRGQIPDRVFTHEWKVQPNGGSGWHRANLLRAAELLREAGWIIKDNHLVHKDTGEDFHIRLLAVSPALAQGWISYSKNLERLGITTSIKSPEISNWLHRNRVGDFDGTSLAFIPPTTPTMLITNRFSSASADRAYSENWTKIRNPAIDSLIEHVYKAKDIDTYYAATRALDRVLLWNFYYIPSGAKSDYPTAWWDKFGIPEHAPLQREIHYDHWWWDEAKARRVLAAINNEES